jgi:hypothetical protein
MNVQKVEYKGWPNCYRWSNGLVDLVVTTDVGPRIIRFSFIGEANEFKEYEEMLGQVGGDQWQIYGGHRLWHAPEAMPRTYCPDNGPVEIQVYADFIRLIQPVEATTGIQKEMDISLAVDRPHVRVVHRLRNCLLWPVEVAPWALSVMAPGGVAILPLPPRGRHEEHLLPTGALVLWAYTDMSDPRWAWGHRYIRLRQDPTRATPQKIGVMAPADNWLAYWRDGHLFLKTFSVFPGVRYPDFGACAEVFTNAEMLELETLGPLTALLPGATVEHTEDWWLFRDVPFPEGDNGVAQALSTTGLL